MTDGVTFPDCGGTGLLPAVEFVPIYSTEMAFGGDKPCFASDGGAAPHRHTDPYKSYYLTGAVFSMSSPLLLAAISRCCESGASHSVAQQLETTESTPTGEYLRLFFSVGGKFGTFSLAPQPLLRRAVLPTNVGSLQTGHGWKGKMHKLSSDTRFRAND